MQDSDRIWFRIPIYSIGIPNGAKAKSAGTSLSGVAESGDDFTKFETIYQWFQTLIAPALMQRPVSFDSDILKLCNFY
ncbi:hypothetical protein RintRC_1978 [Richelia intracellularis]|nr:hypothetical protein RintRC_1978 [Richelia intracellularis]